MILAIFSFKTKSGPILNILQSKFEANRSIGPELWSDIQSNRQTEITTLFIYNIYTLETYTPSNPASSVLKLETIERTSKLVQKVWLWSTVVGTFVFKRFGCGPLWLELLCSKGLAVVGTFVLSNFNLIRLISISNEDTFKGVGTIHKMIFHRQRIFFRNTLIFFHLSTLS